MHVTMVKKRLASGDTCRKCIQAEELLVARRLWERIDEVVWADENDPESPGMRLGREYGVQVAPFFIVREADGSTHVYESVLRLIRERFETPPAIATADAMTDDEIDRAAAELDGRHPAEIVRWALERWGASLGIAFSGAEDVVLIHLAAETGLPFSVFSLDTGRLHPETYRFIDAVRKRYGLAIELLSPDGPTLEAFVKKKGLFSFYDDGHEECCGIRKVQSLRRKLSTLGAWMTGQRRDQSPATRASVRSVERDRTFSGIAGPLAKANPLAQWSSKQTWDFIREQGVPINALHERGFISIGCEPCTRATLPGEHERAGRWWWEESTKRECGLHVTK